MTDAHPVPGPRGREPARTVEFVGMIGASYYSEAAVPTNEPVDHDYLAEFTRVYEDGGFDWTLVPYSSGAPESGQLAGWVLAHTERLKVMLAHRTGVVHPVHAARTFATLDRLSRGRLGIHVLAGSDAEQRREGDYLDKDTRYRRAAEYIRILRRLWSGPGPHDHRGQFYRFDGFTAAVRPVGGPLTISVGGSSEAAYRLGGTEGDVFGLWGEPLAETAEQIAAVDAHADAVGRARPRIWVSFRPILAPTDAQAWRRAEDILGGIRNHHVRNSTTGGPNPRNVGSQRLLAVAARGDRHDRALWTAPAAATDAAGASTALVGSPETVAAALLDYVDIGCDILSVRGYDPLRDARDLGREVLPLVRAELARRGTAVPA
ncbi:LLM class flavin-dependent oxidoreductase [Pseudonocardia lutea]|uniref:LLM class flavin-dependent oxidoreductase n=1 Tax=Pseudonocardia lutea TaxID=2172015 RepID=A0ABW1IDR7_9PSEU